MARHCQPTHSHSLCRRHLYGTQRIVWRRVRRFSNPKPSSMVRAAWWERSTDLGHARRAKVASWLAGEPGQPLFSTEVGVNGLDTGGWCGRSQGTRRDGCRGRRRGFGRQASACPVTAGPRQRPPAARVPATGPGGSGTGRGADPGLRRRSRPTSWHRIGPASRRPPATETWAIGRGPDGAGQMESPRTAARR